MSLFDEADERFARTLFGSAGNDAQPNDVDAAWGRFQDALRSVGQANAGGLLRGSVPAVTFMTRAPRRTAAVVRWVLLGALAGAGGTAAVLRAGPPWHSRDAGPSVLVPPASAPRVANEPPSQAAGPVAPVTFSVPTSRLGPAQPAHEAQAKAHLAEARAPVATARPPAPPLAQEVARLDTARTAIAMGDYDEAIRLVESYHRAFPAGLLAPDADVIAIEAAAAKHDDAETARRAALFLSRYPGDPHTAWVQRLAHAAALGQGP